VSNRKSIPIYCPSDDIFRGYDGIFNIVFLEKLSLLSSYNGAGFKTKEEAEGTIKIFFPFSEWTDEGRLIT
jgi:hypothetical protein